MKYSILIQWSNEDNCFVVTLPEFTNVMQPVTHGETYEEALKNAVEVLELLKEDAPPQDPQSLPNSWAAIATHLTSVVARYPSF